MHTNTVLFNFFRPPIPLLKIDALTTNLFLVFKLTVTSAAGTFNSIVHIEQYTLGMHHPPTYKSWQQQCARSNYKCDVQNARMVAHFGSSVHAVLTVSYSCCILTIRIIPDNKNVIVWWSAHILNETGNFSEFGQR